MHYNCGKQFILVGGGPHSFKGEWKKWLSLEKGQNVSIYSVSLKCPANMV